MRLNRHILLVLGAMLAFSFMALFTRQANIPFLTIAAWRSLLVAAAFAAWTVAASPRRWRALRPEPTTLRHGLLYGLALALASSTFVGGYAFTTVANTIFLHNLAPLAAFPLAWWLFGERPAANAVTGAALAIAGVALLSGVSLFNLGHFTHPRFVLGDFLALVSAMGYAAVLVATRAARQAGTPIVQTLYVAWATAAAALLSLALVSGQLTISAADLFWVLLLAVLCTNLPFYLLNLGMRQVSAGMASVLSMSEVLFASLLGWLVFSEIPAPLAWFGGALVLVGVLYALSVQSGASARQQPGGARLPSESCITLRWMRLLPWLALLNVGALAVMLYGQETGALLVWIAVTAMLRLFPVPALSTLGSRRFGLLRWAWVLGPLLLLLLLYQRGGWGSPETSLAIMVPALLAPLLDRLLQNREQESERDWNLLPGVAALCLVLSQVFHWMGHWGGAVLLVLSAAVLVATAWGMIADALAKALPLPGPSETSASRRLEYLLRRLGRPVPLLVLLGLLYLLGGVRSVPMGGVAIVERLGAPLPLLEEPGLLIRLPPPWERVTTVDSSSIKRVELVDPDTPLLCGDHSLVAMQAVLHYRVADAFEYTYNTADPPAELRSLGRAAVVETVGHISQDTILTDGRRQVEESVRQYTQQAVDQVGLGAEILDVHLGSVAVPAQVLASFLDVISAEEEKRTSINLAEAYAAQVLPRAYGESVARTRKAEADAFRLLARSQGYNARLRAQRQGGIESLATTRYRIEMEHLEQSLSGQALVLAPAHRRLWLGTEPMFGHDSTDTVSAADNTKE